MTQRACGELPLVWMQALNAACRGLGKYDVPSMVRAVVLFGRFRDSGRRLLSGPCAPLSLDSSVSAHECEAAEAWFVVAVCMLLALQIDLDEETSSSVLLARCGGDSASA